MQKVSVIYKGITVTSEIDSINVIRIGPDGNIYLEEESKTPDGKIKWPTPRVKMDSTPPAKKGSMREYITKNFPEVGVIKTVKGNVKTIYGAFIKNNWKPSVKFLKDGSYSVTRVA